ncbi:response regulator [Bradyrhizobium sp. ISRA442]|uniref:response regulator n=1 Tax=unclassified Bradyrhizobium TaxID=2631580 RepID=UPI00311AF4A8
MAGAAGKSNGFGEVVELPTVLVAEDESLIQETIEDALKEGGFATAVVSSAEEGLTLLDGGGDYKALVTDIDLHGRMTGWELAKRARQMLPALAVVCMMGAAAHEWRSQGCQKAFCSRSHSPQRKPSPLSQHCSTSRQFLECPVN